LPVPRTFTYGVEGDVAVVAGTRVLVPFGRRRLIGWVVGPGDESTEAARIRPVISVLDDEPGVPPELLELCRWIADYFVAPLGQVLRTALPAVLSDTARPAPPVRTQRILRIVRELPSLQQRVEIFGRAQRQRDCYELLETTGGRGVVAHLVEQLGFSRPVLQGLVDKGLAVFEEEVVERDPFAGKAPADPGNFTLTPAQRLAVDALVTAARAGGAGTPAGVADVDSAMGAAGGHGVGGLGGAEDGGVFLLRGVTGSGKTLVYIELLREVVERQGRGAIVLVPEIALTPQTVARFRSYFGSSVAVLHSALSDGERYDAWLSLRRGERRIAVGARSAVFAPVADLGAIIVDEEHEATYKQSEAPRYHARDIAIVRARLAGAVCVLGSATPSLESWENARLGKSRLLELPERVEGRPLPPVRVIDLRRRGGEGRTGENRGGGDGGAGSGLITGGEEGTSRAPAAGPSILSTPLVEAIEDRLRRGEQTILLLNRRGYSSFVQCRDCGAVWHCPACNVSLTYHRARRRMVCHYCFLEEPAPIVCDSCGSPDLSFRGAGTEQVERTVSEFFPAARVARMDVDTTSAKWSHHEILGRVERGEVDLLLGTQMIAKGLDFPNVTLVGVINADVGIHLPDFRATERTFQLLTQVAGRAGRGPRGGEVLVQTSLPEHYVIRAAVEHDFVGFAERELEERRGPGYPPHLRLANIVVSGVEEFAVQEGVEELADWLRGVLAAPGFEGVELTGPAPCPVSRIRGRWRWHLLLRSERVRPLGIVLRELLLAAPLRRGRAHLLLVLDRDPDTLL
jgi:primosomal protein N' (replication factor Y)